MNRAWHNIFLLAIIALVISCASLMQFGITDYLPTSLAVTTGPSIEVTRFNYSSLANISTPYPIFVEVLNDGEDSYIVKIEEYIYLYNESSLKLEEVAYYHDSETEISPNSSRLFETNFVTDRVAYYYIKLKVTYGNRRLEEWGTFYSWYPYPTPVLPATEFPTIIYIDKAPAISIDYAENVSLYPGESTMTKFILRNIGNATLHEVKLHLSASSMLNVELDPRESYYLDSNKTMVFFIDIFAPNNIPISEYPIYFELMSREIKETGNITVNILDHTIPIEEEISSQILNYDYLLAQLEREIFEASENGANVTLAEIDMESAKEKMQKVKEFYDAGEYNETDAYFNEIKNLIKESTLKMMQSSKMTFPGPSMTPVWAGLIIVVIAVFLFLAKSGKNIKKRLSKRPKLLKSSEEAET